MSSTQLSLRFAGPTQEGDLAGPRAIEMSDFPFELISQVAERESWRKEINRPIYHVHKWWAQRLGSVFRSIIIGALSPAGSDVLSKFYSNIRFPNAIVFDPFMGSGTTLGETLKLSEQEMPLVGSHQPGVIADLGVLAKRRHAERQYGDKSLFRVRVQFFVCLAARQRNFENAVRRRLFPTFIDPLDVIIHKQTWRSLFNARSRVFHSNTNS